MVARRDILAAAGLLLLLFPVLAGCGDDPVETPGTPSSTLAFTVRDSVRVAFEGEAAWPPAGEGVVARIDSSGTSLVIAAYRQTSGKTSFGPEPRYTMAYFSIVAPEGISTGPQLPAIAFFTEDLAIAAFDSLAYAAVSGSFVISSLSADRVSGTFSGSAERISDGSPLSVTNGSFNAALSTGTLSLGDTGSSGGGIVIAVGSGVAPVYTWAGGPVYALGVARASAPASLVWGIVTAGGDSIATGVTHGTVPGGASGVANVEPVLTPGVAYRVTVSRVGGAYGFVTFTPAPGSGAATIRR